MLQLQENKRGDFAKTTAFGRYGVKTSVIFIISSGLPRPGLAGNLVNPVYSLFFLNFNPVLTVRFNRLRIAAYWAKVSQPAGCVGDYSASEGEFFVCL